MVLVCGGVWQLSWVDERIVVPVQVRPAILTVVDATKFDPLIITPIPPAEDPAPGKMAVMVGGS